MTSAATGSSSSLTTSPRRCSCRPRRWSPYDGWVQLGMEDLIARLNHVADELCVTSSALRWRLGRAAASGQVKGAGNPRSCATQQWTDDARRRTAGVVLQAVRGSARGGGGRGPRVGPARGRAGGVADRGPGGAVRGPPRRARDRPLNGTLDRGVVSQIVSWTRTRSSKFISDGSRVADFSHCSGGWRDGNGRRLRDGDPGDGIPGAYSPGVIGYRPTSCARRRRWFTRSRQVPRRRCLACGRNRVGLARRVGLAHPCASRRERLDGACRPRDKAQLVRCRLQALRLGNGSCPCRNCSTAWAIGSRIPLKRALHEAMARWNAQTVRSQRRLMVVWGYVHGKVHRRTDLDAFRTTTGGWMTVRDAQGCRGHGAKGEDPPKESG